MINYQTILFGTMGIFIILDILGVPSGTVGIFLGWLIGLMTKTQWDIKKETKSEEKQ